MVRTDVLDEVGSDKFFDHMDELLNFQNDDLEDGLFGSGAVDVDSFPPVWFDEPAQLSSTGRSKGLSDVSSADRTPRYDIVRLEWLSNFVQDSLSKVKTLPLCHAKRARSKRPRPATFYPPPSYFLYPKKKQKKKLPTIGGSNGQSDNKEEDPLEDPPRKCTHCEITKTPLWRTGPNGPKTLCNACGVRYKKGLLFPEYRPAASPTFVPLLHSNSYKKVFEMRKSKNLGETVQPEHCLNSNKTDKGHEITNSTLCGEALEARKGTFTTLEDPVTTSDLGETVQPEHCLNSNKTDKGLEITNSALCGETFEAGKVRSTTLEDSVTTSDLVSLQV